MSATVAVYRYRMEMSVDDLNLLEAAQRPLQNELLQTARRLLDAGTSDDDRADAISRLRDESEDAWERCNAFLLAYAISRCCEPAETVDDRGVRAGLHDRFADEFIDAVASGLPALALECWTHPPMLIPPLPPMAKQTAMLVAVLDEAIRRQTRRTSPQALVDAFPDGVWIELSDDPAHVGVNTEP